MEDFLVRSPPPAEKEKKPEEKSNSLLEQRIKTLEQKLKISKTAAQISAPQISASQNTKLKEMLDAAYRKSFSLVGASKKEVAECETQVGVSESVNSASRHREVFTQGVQVRKEILESTKPTESREPPEERCIRLLAEKIRGEIEERFLSAVRRKMSSLLSARVAPAPGTECDAIVPRLGRSRNRDKERRRKKRCWDSFLAARPSW